MTNELKELVEIAAANIGPIFDDVGEIMPMCHAIRGDGEHMLISLVGFPDKDEQMRALRIVLRQHKVQRYVIMGEAWVGTPMDNTSIVKALRHGIADHPDRREVVHFSAEERGGRSMTACRYILRPEHGKPTLSPLKIMPESDYSVGRMVGLLAD